MTLIKYDKGIGLPTPFERLSKISRDDHFGFFPGFFSRSHINTTTPSVNTRETKVGYEIELVAPGLDKSDFKINLENDVLTISSKKQTSTSTEDDGYILKEFSHNSFNRSFMLPDNVDEDNMCASYKNGILKLELKKVKEAKKISKAIEVL